MTALTDLVWNGREDADHKRAKIRRSIAESELTLARVKGMKIRAGLTPPTAAQGGFPYPARTCAEWIHQDQRGLSPLKRRGRCST